MTQIGIYTLSVFVKHIFESFEEFVAILFLKIRHEILNISYKNEMIREKNAILAYILLSFASSMRYRKALVIVFEFFSVYV